MWAGQAMKRFTGVALAAAVALGAGGAAAQPQGQQDDQDQAALLLATLVGGYSPTLSAAHKTVLTHYLAGNGRTDARAGKIAVQADQVSCTAGDEDATAFACDLKFGAGAVHLTARAASQVFAALEMAVDDSAPSPAGRYGVSVSGLKCVLDAATIAGETDGGADCVYMAGATSGPPASDPSAQPVTLINVDDDSSMLVAALVGAYSPTAAAADKAVLTHYLAGQPTLDAAAAKFQVNADKVACNSSNRNLKAWTCDLTFGAKTVHLTARAASELDTALNLTGLLQDVAMGTSAIGAKPMRCTLDPAAIATRTKGGAVCALTDVSMAP
jgi:hypothetical protein